MFASSCRRRSFNSSSPELPPVTVVLSVDRSAMVALHSILMTSDRTPHAFPQFSTPEEERTHRKQRLAAAFRLFGHFGFDEGVAGHIPARDPELLDHFWVNPFGMNFKQIQVKDLILVNDQGEVVDGNWPVNRAA